MADEQAIPIPQGLDLCGNQSDLNLFLEVLNANFELAASLSETEQSTTLTLPGLPMVAIPGYPYPIGAQKEALDTAWIGGRYPIGSPAGKFSAQGNAPGLNLGATNGLQFAVNAIGYNFQIIANALPSVVTQLVTVPMLSFDPCKVPGGPDALINQLNQQLVNLINQVRTGGGTPLPGSCPGTIVVPVFDGGCWTINAGAESATFRQDVTSATGNVLQFIVGRGGSANPATGAPSGSGCATAGKKGTLTAFLDVFSLSGGINSHPACAAGDFIDCLLVDLDITLAATLTGSCVPDFGTGPVVPSVPVNNLQIITLDVALNDYDGSGNFLNSRAIYFPSTTDPVFIEFDALTGQSRGPTIANCEIAQPPAVGAVGSALAISISVFADDELVTGIGSALERYEWTGSVTLGSFGFH